MTNQKTQNLFSNVLLFGMLVLFLGCNAPKEESYDATGTLKEYVSYFNQMEEEGVVNHISNEESYSWLEKNIPLFEAPDSTLEQTYYYRWWTFRKHLKKTPEGFVFTEFIRPVSHAGKYNTVSCALGHHVYEGRWLHDDKFIDEYILFWLIRDQYAENPQAHKYSSWLADAVYHRYLVNKDEVFVSSLVDELNQDYRQWHREKGLSNGLYWQYDVRDGMEESISGSRTDKNARPTINSYMYGNAVALANLSDLIGRDSLQEAYQNKASRLKQLVREELWDSDAQFFKAQLEDGTLSDAREAIGFIPWYFDLPADKENFARAWDQLEDPQGFLAPCGLTTAERRHPEFRTHGTGECEWDGAVWPFATTQTLKGMAKLLTGYSNHSVQKEDYFEVLKTYANSHEKNGKPYIGEYLDGKTGEWLKGDNPRSRYYNHSGFADLIINDLIGLKPQPGDSVVVKPLIPEGKWDWFLLDNVKYHDRILIIQWDKTGEKYGNGQGLRIFADGEQIYQSDTLKPATCELPGASDAHPVQQVGMK
ncbi:MGH1-like glycoside hydrolase domain-containing protein [Fodinibius salsisoli]|uniref:Trehalase n=1 Tax=Fodinibius salsisoli TaxID=2820877 RepID=A0ABT3PH93_9BACT|nr:trehalase family glycosidase [Fodinibius salsisoli]MCW9705288.1 hypothetical protein [Fodinibius salsisoli]